MVALRVSGIVKELLDNDTFLKEVPLSCWICII